MARGVLASDLDYDLPESLIAQAPAPERDGARMLTLAEGLCDGWVRDFCESVPEDSLVVLNDSLVMPARVLAQRSTGGKVELLFLNAASPARREELSGSRGGEVWQVLARSNRPLARGQIVEVSPGGAQIEILGSGDDGSRFVRLTAPVRTLLEKHGHMPLPPYIRRKDDSADRERYQTVFAAHWGSAAAPTAGLHLTRAALSRLAERGVDIGFVTLHVGAGTFRPVSGEVVEDHPMHTEQYEVGETLEGQVAEARRRRGPVIAVGTTVVRALESAAVGEGRVAAGRAATQLLITPGYSFRVVDGLLTNFHAPRSTLLALLFAFAGTRRVQEAYSYAVANRYRFLSYGDALWVPPQELSYAEPSPV